MECCFIPVVLSNIKHILLSINVLTYNYITFPSPIKLQIINWINEMDENYVQYYLKNYL